MKPSSAQRPWLRPVSADEGAPDSGRRSEPSDEELIDAILQGDARVAGQIHDRLIRVIDHTLFRIFGCRQYDHDDLIQTCFEQVLRTLTDRTFAGNCSLRTWAGRITTHVGLNALRSRQRERRVIYRSEAPPPPCSHLSSRPGSAEASVELDRVRLELSRMKPSQAEVLVLHDVHGYHLAEIASMMGVSVSAAQSRLVRGRRELHQRLERRPSQRPGAPR